MLFVHQMISVADLGQIAKIHFAGDIMPCVMAACMRSDNQYAGPFHQNEENW